jgi:hypothetical protein
VRMRNPSSKPQRPLLVLGVALIVGSPLIVMIPEFTPPDHCPPCMNFPSVSYPFIPVGVGVGVIGLILAIFGYLRLRRVTHRLVTTWPLGFIALVLILAGYFLMGYTVRGSGWAITLYSAQGVYLLALGFAVALYALIGIFATQRSSIMLSVGMILASLSLLEFAAEPSELGTRCNVEAGCNALLAQSTVVGFIMWGLVLAFAAFLMGCGIASFRRRSWHEVS